jgi:hypothetical protein
MTIHPQSFQLARVYSKFLAVQIMATEDGLMPREGVKA